jgi:hypothetical protein
VNVKGERRQRGGRIMGEELALTQQERVEQLHHLTKTDPDR